MIVQGPPKVIHVKHEDDVKYKASADSCASWNSLLLWARRTRGPQFDYATAQCVVVWHVDRGSLDYYAGLEKDDGTATAPAMTLQPSNSAQQQQLSQHQQQPAFAVPLGTGAQPQMYSYNTQFHPSATPQATTLQMAQDPTQGSTSQQQPSLPGSVPGQSSAQPNASLAHLTPAQRQMINHQMSFRSIATSSPSGMPIPQGAGMGAINMAQLQSSQGGPAPVSMPHTNTLLPSYLMQR